MTSTHRYPPLDVSFETGGQKKSVDYFYDQAIGNFAYAAGHPMKQHRVRLAHSLVMNYDLYTKMKIFRPLSATKAEMSQFHAEDYVDFLSRVTPENFNMGNYPKEMQKFNVGEDSPVFDGLFEYCAISTGGSLEGAARLGNKKCDIAVNWAGGLHHAKRSEASGFCYVNDIVIAIIELLRTHARVLYIDIDVHHGDGVEEAFFTTDRVMTVSLHQYGEFFPGTGELRDVGADKGKNYSVNFPLRTGIDDVHYKAMFEAVITRVMERFRPGAIVLQCGGDSLAGDRLGSLNLSMRGHANCVAFVKKFGVPTLILGGGGYTMRNVSRTWAYETGVAVGVELPQKIPVHEYTDYYGPDFSLDVKAKKGMHNQNSADYLEKIKVKIFENLDEIPPVPSVQMQDVPKSFGVDEEYDAVLDDADEDDNPDVRYTDRRADQHVVDSRELYDTDEFSNGTGHGQRNTTSSKQKSALDIEDIMDTTNLSSPSPSASPEALAPRQMSVDVEMADVSDIGPINQIISVLPPDNLLMNQIVSVAPAAAQQPKQVLSSPSISSASTVSSPRSPVAVVPEILDSVVSERASPVSTKRSATPTEDELPEESMSVDATEKAPTDAIRNLEIEPNSKDTSPAGPVQPAFAQERSTTKALTPASESEPAKESIPAAEASHEASAAEEFLESQRNIREIEKDE